MSPLVALSRCESSIGSVRQVSKYGPMWSSTVVDRRAEAAAVSAIAGGSQHSMTAISDPRADFLNAEPRSRVERQP
jgi:hypothetical protein